MAISTSLDIINSALILLDQAQLTADELVANTSKTAKICTLKWPTCRDALIRLVAWNCLRERKILIIEETAPEFGFLYKYALPTSPYCLRPLAIQYEKDGDYFSFENSTFANRPLKYQFTIEKRFLLTNTPGTTLNREETEGINLVYSFRPTDDVVSDYDDTLIELFYYKLTSEIAYSLTGSRNLGLSFYDQYKEMLKAARSINAQENSPNIPLGKVLQAYN